MEKLYNTVLSSKVFEILNLWEEKLFMMHVRHRKRFHFLPRCTILRRWCEFLHLPTFWMALSARSIRDYVTSWVTIHVSIFSLRLHNQWWISQYTTRLKCKKKLQQIKKNLSSHKKNHTRNFVTIILSKCFSCNMWKNKHNRSPKTNLNSQYHLYLNVKTQKRGIVSMRANT